MGDGEFDERIMPGAGNKAILEEHMTRYNLALDYVRGKKVLDVACGTGYRTYYLASKGKTISVTGIDISKEAINYARSHYQSPDIQFQTGDVTRLDSDDNEFDVVVSFETIEHIENTEDYLNEISRVLDSRGIFIISTPNRRLSSRRNPYHVNLIGLDEFRGLLATRFPEVEILGQNHQDFWERAKRRVKQKVAYVIPAGLRKRVPTNIRLGYDEQHIGGITNHEVENCRGFLAICAKN